MTKEDNLNYYAPKEPSQEYLSKLQNYNINTVTGSICNKQGKEILSKDNKGYYRLTLYVNGKAKTLKRCHVIYYAYFNIWPINEIDHIDRNKGNDAISNLRTATRSEQTTNRHNVLKRNLPVGVYLQVRMKTKPYAAIFKGKHIGYYATVEDASEAYQQKKATDND